MHPYVNISFPTALSGKDDNKKGSSGQSHKNIDNFNMKVPTMLPNSFEDEWKKNSSLIEKNLLQNPQEQFTY